MHAVTVPAAPAFRLHVSNRLEDLAAALAHEIRAEPGDPLAPERIVVPHPVLGRWLALELASRLGIAAHLKLELPAEFAWSLMRSTVERERERKRKRKRTAEGAAVCAGRSALAHLRRAR